MQHSGDPSQPERQIRLNMIRWKMILQTNGTQRKLGLVLLISDKIDFKTKTQETKTGIL